MHAVYQYCLLTFCNFLTKQDYFLATSNCTRTVTQFADNKVRHGLWKRTKNILTVMCDYLVKRLNSNHLYRTFQYPRITAPKHWHLCFFQSQVRGNEERSFQLPLQTIQLPSSCYFFISVGLHIVGHDSVLSHGTFIKRCKEAIDRFTYH